MRNSAVSNFLISRAKWLIWLCALASLSAPVSRFLPTDQFANTQWALELFAHWQWLYIIVGAFCLFLLFIVRRAWWPVIPAAVLGSSFFMQSATLERGTEPAGAESVLTVGTTNLNFGTRDFSALTRWLLSADAPDVVFLQEFTAQAQTALQNPGISSQYPHRLEVPQQDQFGLAVLSRHALADMEKLEPQDMRETLRLRARLAWNGKTVHLSALHPMPPVDAAYARIRDQTLFQEAAHLSQAGGLALIVGDFNATPWTRGLFDIDSKMARASGFSGTWPNMFGWLSVLPLDHVLASREWQVLGSGFGPDVGSDHRPVVVRLRAR